MDGIINILKPPGMTSHDVVAYIRKLTGIKKVGHTGTLDPLAVGVLPICLGKATKASNYIANGTKTYRTELKLGIITATGDAEGNVISQCDWNTHVNKHKFYSTIDRIVKEFVGQSTQIPPMYSAVKVQGKKLYELARSGQQVERKPRKIEIYDIKVIDYSSDDGTILFDVTCSKGTYIRVLCEDIGKKIGCGAYMTYLIRTEVSRFNIENAITLEQLKLLADQNQLSKGIIPTETVFLDYQKYVIEQSEEQKRFINGAKININPNDLQLVDIDFIRIYVGNKFIGIAKLIKQDLEIQAKVEQFFI